MILKPNFFIVGTPKSGTTSLFHYFEANPEIFVPQVKEPHYFSCPEVKETYYKTEIIDNDSDYLNLYKTENEYKAIGDFSSSYLFNKSSAKRIKEFNPEAKIIIVLRNPAERALSHYLMDFNLGYVDVSLIEIINNRKQYQKFYEQYIELGLYHEQIAIYQQYFNSSNIKVILSDLLYSDTEETVKSLFDFINTSSSINLDLSQKYNQYNEPRFKILKQFIQSSKLKNIIPLGLKETLKKIIYKQNAEKPKFVEEKLILEDLYKDSILETEKIIGQDLSIWKSK